MKNLTFHIPARKAYTTLRLWTITRKKLKAVADYLDLPLTELMEHVAVQLYNQVFNQSSNQPSDKETK